jgi:hypothetical protein
MSQTLEELKVSIVDITKPVNVLGKDYTIDLTRVKWSQMLDYSSELMSGMVLKSYKDQNGEDVSEIQMTKEYAGKRNKVITDMVRVLFALDIVIDDVPVEQMFELVELVTESGFLERLERLSQGSSTKKKSTTR